ncbi:MAG: sulfatase-like hydrolase/transferase [Planctomycetota bacterium]|jgi:arylsulfatase A-like enzyme
MSENTKPNILFILADDLGWGDLSLHGSPIRTPNIDRLAEDGVELTQHYVCPMCTPTRASLLTGKYPGRFGVHATTPTNYPVMPDNYKTIANHLKDAGYDTGIFGKWHMGSKDEWGPNHFGFDYSYGSLAGGVDPYNHCYKKSAFCKTWHRNEELMDEPGHATDLITDETIEWIKERKNPWFCYVPFTAVHLPVKSPFEWIDKYQFGEYDADPKKNRSFKRYAAYTSHMDHAIGRMVETLEKLNIRDNTIIVFTSDNGAISSYPLHSTDMYPGWQEEAPRTGSNGPFRGQKCQIYEGGVRTPAVISWRGELPAWKKVDHPVYIADWMPTFMKLAGAEDSIPKVDGIDIWDTIKSNKTPTEEREIYWNFRGRDFGVRYGDWKLICNKDKEPQLFNIAVDPYEKTDLAAEKPEMVKTLQKRIADQQQKDDSDKRDDIEEIINRY